MSIPFKDLTGRGLSPAFASDADLLTALDGISTKWLANELTPMIGMTVANPSNRDYLLAENELKRLQRSRPDTYRACTSCALSVDIPADLTADLEAAIANYFTEVSAFSGKIWYRPGNCMSWHTNRDQSDSRLYLTYVTEDDKSFFRYQDPDTGEIITDLDKTGWQARIFDLGAEKPLWHCVCADTERLSLGVALTAA